MQTLHQGTLNTLMPTCSLRVSDSGGVLTPTPMHASCTLGNQSSACVSPPCCSAPGDMALFTMAVQRSALMRDKPDRIMWQVRVVANTVL